MVTALFSDLDSILLPVEVQRLENPSISPVYLIHIPSLEGFEIYSSRRATSNSMKIKELLVFRWISF